MVPQSLRPTPPVIHLEGPLSLFWFLALTHDEYLSIPITQRTSPIPKIEQSITNYLLTYAKFPVPYKSLLNSIQPLQETHPDLYESLTSSLTPTRNIGPRNKDFAQSLLNEDTLYFLSTPFLKIQPTFYYPSEVNPFLTIFKYLLPHMFLSTDQVSPDLPFEIYVDSPAIQGTERVIYDGSEYDIPHSPDSTYPSLRFRDETLVFHSSGVLKSHKVAPPSFTRKECGEFQDYLTQIFPNAIPGWRFAPPPKPVKTIPGSGINNIPRHMDDTILGKF